MALKCLTGNLYRKVRADTAYYFTINSVWCELNQQIYEWSSARSARVSGTCPQTSLLQLDRAAGTAYRVLTPTRPRYSELLRLCFHWSQHGAHKAGVHRTLDSDPTQALFGGFLVLFTSYMELAQLRQQPALSWPYDG